ncbi:hypothetical protein KIPB_001735 [Kipferlia bialata]|uniref:Uncharacterized protein n=1 Tax=Kipferlia bialata TaxID=797122 RepID=A0A9K3GFP2_9EUKA|nr:hypothetical protein KIPB_001735 [Kipferlia bialata]|eukprot:g1735.t1
MQGVPWYTDCTKLPGLCSDYNHSDLSFAPIGDRRLLATFRSHEDEEQTDGPGWRECLILSVSPDKTITSHTVNGPHSLNNAEDIRLIRLSDYVAALGQRYDRVTETWSMGMALFSIATETWEHVPMCVCCGPSARYRYVTFALGETLVVCGGDLRSTNTTGNDTWEWSLETRKWTRTEDAPLTGVSTSDEGTVVEDTFRMYFGKLFHMEYCDGKWKWEIHQWNHFDDDTHGGGYYSRVGVPLLRNMELTITKLGTDDHPDDPPPKCWVRDYVSQDLVPLEPLPLTPEDMDDHQIMTVVMLDATTLLVSEPDFTLLVDIDPHLLGPECHTSMVGTGFWEETEEEEEEDWESSYEESESD